MDNILNKIPEKIYHKFKDIYPFPIMDFANDLGLDIYETYDLSENEAGLIRKEDDKYVIYVNAKDIPTRKRFTIAHEIGHYILHKNDLDSDNEFIDNRRQPYANGMHRGTNTEHDYITKSKEIDANKFAASLLMPSEKFKEIFNDADNIDDVATFFKVSSSAASIRAKELLNMIIW